MRRSAKVDLKCLQCGAAFSVAVWRQKRGRKFCTLKCANLSQRQPLDLESRSGRYRARKRGEAVAKQQPGVKAQPFWSLVDKSPGGCWLFMGRLNRDGYGVYSRDGKNHMAHRLAWALAGNQLPRGLVLMHKCDTPACVNTAHLSLGTHRDNQLDKVAKGRQAIGSRVGVAILNEEQAAEIRSRFVLGAKGDGSARAIAARYGVSVDTVRAIGKGRHWRHA